ncbi:MAG: iron-containing alcohol dehydrogenase [Bryobacteraceae bacterium]
MRFEFTTVPRIVFGTGSVATLPAAVREYGSKILLVRGSSAARAAGVVAMLQAENLSISEFAIEEEPTVPLVREGVRAAKGHHCVIGFGGGSVIDAAKAIAALEPNSGEPLDYMEVVGKGRLLERNPLPFIAMPTTAGTGAEVTRNAVIGSPEHGVKASLRSPHLLAKLAIIDPEFTTDLSREITAYTGLDALTQLIEPYTSCRANVLTDGFCLDGMLRASPAVRTVYHDAQNKPARQSMSYASLLGGLALSNAGLGAVHGFAAPLGGMLKAHHGALCAAVLPHALGVNIRAARRRLADSELLARYQKIARTLTGKDNAEADDAVSWVNDLCQELGIQPLRHHGLTKEQIPALVDQASRASSMKANGIPLLRDELIEIAERAF